MPLQLENIRLLKRGTLTWHDAWAEVRKKYGSTDCYDKDTGESWQYMCSVIRDNGQVEHQFRHRSLKGKRENFSAHMPFDGDLSDYQPIGK